ncbi:hypothetical protein GGS26DRAFT_535592 [Hypomontagnella submonticulosa]|nr:hypothetical protein GGS26DRAFT_535592 [Hypomontagnella submonticulosa]
MAIIELVFPQLKKDPESVKGSLEKLPIAFKAFQDGGVIRGLSGFVTTENGKDVTADSRELIVLEWPEAAAFYKFIESPGFANFAAEMMPFSAGPPELNLFETNPGTHLFGSNPVLEILLVKPTGSSDEDAQAVLKKVQSALATTNDSEAVYGTSLNLPQKKITVLKVVANKADLDAAKNAKSRQEIQKEVGSTAEVTQLVADVKLMPF